MYNEKLRKNTPDEMIEVITAHKEGKAIEYRDVDEQEWCEVTPAFNFADYQYRVKPEEKFIFIIRDDRQRWCTLHEVTQEHAEQALKHERNMFPEKTFTMTKYKEIL